MRLLRSIRKNPLDLVEIESIVREEPAFTYKLLRYLNSPVMERKMEVRSIRCFRVAGPGGCRHSPVKENLMQEDRFIARQPIFDRRRLVETLLIGHADRLRGI